MNQEQLQATVKRLLQQKSRVYYQLSDEDKTYAKLRGVTEEYYRMEKLIEKYTGSKNE